VPEIDEATPAQAPSTTTERQALKLGVEPRERGRPLVANSNPAPKPVVPAPVVEASAPSAPVETVAISQPAPPADDPLAGRSYTVQPGDSLWFIARRLLGADASNGQLAREVNRLWRLNEERIGTGDPSLLHIGTELRLR
jgi:pilus assembly protein FimV